MKQAETNTNGKTESADGTGRRNLLPEATDGSGGGNQSPPAAVETGMNRREFICDAGRLCLLAGLAGLAAKILAKGQATNPGRDCWNGGSCGGCPVRDGCGKLAALKFKANPKPKGGKHET